MITSSTMIETEMIRPRVYVSYSRVYSSEKDAMNFLLDFCRINANIEGMSDILKTLLSNQSINITNNNLSIETQKSSDIASTAQYVQSLIFKSMDEKRNITRGIDEKDI